VLGGLEDLPDVVRDTGAQHLILAFTEDPDEQLVGVARTAQGLGMDVSVVPRLYDAVGERVRVEHLGGLPVLNLHRVDPHGWQFVVKHALGRTLAGIGLLLLSPVMITLALLVRASSPGPVFFRQRRVGRDGKPFDVLKFRSMRLPGDGQKAFELKAGAAPGGVEGEDRRTRVGTFMRRTSLDELPQLINVLRGEMALVGPRPERPEFVALFEEQIRRYGERHRVKAGITGWAQVHGLRGQTSIADRAEWDNYYIENWSLRLDAKILALTFLTLFRRSED
jgi:exopolysaccharide biosynthesis polyprenyl glycosylphosphotransferase